MTLDLTVYDKGLRVEAGEEELGYRKSGLLLRFGEGEDCGGGRNGGQNTGVPLKIPAAPLARRSKNFSEKAKQELIEQ